MDKALAEMQALFSYTKIIKKRKYQKMYEEKLEVRIARMQVESANKRWLENKSKGELVQMYRDINAGIGDWYRFWKGAERFLQEAKDEKRWLNNASRNIVARLTSM